MNTLVLNNETLAQLTEGVVFLDDHGWPKSVTVGSEPWLRHCIEMAPVLAGLIAESKAGKLHLPVAVDLHAEGEDARQAPDAAWLVENVGLGHALLIRPASAANPAIPDEQFLTLLGTRVQHEITRLSTILRNSGQSSDDRMRHILRQSLDFDALILEIGELAELYQRDRVFFEERLSIAELVQAVIVELRQQRIHDFFEAKLPLPALLREAIAGLHQRRLPPPPGYDIEGGDIPSIGPLHGSAKWLKNALLALFSGLEEGCSSSGRLRVQLRLLSDFIVLSASGTENSARSITKPSEHGESGNPQLPPPYNALRMRICRRIIKLHGGQLSLRMLADEHEDSGGAIHSFTLTLPTGLPTPDRSHASCTECRIQLQSLQYARDLAKVMALSPLSTATLEKGVS